MYLRRALDDARVAVIRGFSEVYKDQYGDRFLNREGDDAKWTEFRNALHVHFTNEFVTSLKKKVLPGKATTFEVFVRPVLNYGPDFHMLLNVNSSCVKEAGEKLNKTYHLAFLEDADLPAIFRYFIPKFVDRAYDQKKKVDEAREILHAFIKEAERPTISDKGKKVAKTGGKRDVEDVGLSSTGSPLKRSRWDEGPGTLMFLLSGVLL